MKQNLECIMNAKVCECKTNLLKVFLKMGFAFKFSWYFHRKRLILTLKQSLHFKKT